MMLKLSASRPNSSRRSGERSSLCSSSPSATARSPRSSACTGPLIERVSQSAISVATARAIPSAATESRSASVRALSARSTLVEVATRSDRSIGLSRRSVSASAGAMTLDSIESACASRPERHASYSLSAVVSINASRDRIGPVTLSATVRDSESACVRAARIASSSCRCTVSDLTTPSATWRARTSPSASRRSPSASEALNSRSRKVRTSSCSRFIDA